MMPIFHRRGFLVVSLLAAVTLPLILATDDSDCNRICGSITVPYPFGFSGSCRILLTCNTTALGGGSMPEIVIDQFLVRNITFDAILIDVPPACNRPIEAARGLFGHNYALTRRNGLFLRSCSNNLSGCVIPTDLFSQRFDLGSCRPKDDKISCYSIGNTAGFLTYQNVSDTGCGFLFTSLDYQNLTSTTSFPSLVFRTAELGWWLDGECSCASNANCTRLLSPVTNNPAFRCQCEDGFEGDGFVNGTGCIKATAQKCNPSKYLSGNCGGTTRVGVLIGGIIAGATIMSALALACYLIRRRSTDSRIRRSTKQMLSQASCVVPLYQFREIERATNGFSEDQRLGTGAYATVYAGKLGNDDALVAIKRIRNRDTDGFEQVMNEIKLVSSVSHPNLVRLLGCCIERGEQILVYEFMHNGTLSQHLQRERGNGLPWTVRLTIATETAKAIAYLHSAMHPPIYHRDIKSSNILLDYNFNSKVADFGLSRIVVTEFSHISTVPQGTPGYLDPQYHQNYHLSDKSDVYSFGVVLVEIITALKAVDFSRPQSDVNLAALAIDKIGKGMVEEIVDPFLEPHRDAWTLASIHKVAELAFRCLAFHRDMRPSMMEVADELEQIRLSGWAATDDDNIILSPASSPPRSALPSGNSDESRPLADELKLESPVSVQDPWFSGKSSPSTNSLLGKVMY